MNPVARIPLLDTYLQGEFMKLFKDDTKIEKVISCKLLDVHGHEIRDYLICNEAIVPGVWQRTIYKKGRAESEKIGSIMIDLASGHYCLKLLNPMDRPAGVDLHITIETVQQESKCLNSSSEECQLTQAVA